MVPWGVASPGAAGGPSGFTYGGLAVRAPDQRGRLVAALRAIRFSGWVGPPEDGWVLAVAAQADGAVAAGRRGLLEVGAWLGPELDTTVVAVRVLRDRQLVLGVWSGGEEVGRYVSDPAYGQEDDDVLPFPIGAEHAEAFAAAVGTPEGADELEELLAEELDPDSVIESERLAGVLRTLALPGWLVASVALPKDVPGGPRAAELIRLGAGVPGVAGRLVGRAVEVVRSRLRPPPVVADPPRGASGPDPWLF
jgi:hypothetical protein